MREGGSGERKMKVNNQGLTCNQVSAQDVIIYRERETNVSFDSATNISIRSP